MIELSSSQSFRVSLETIKNGTGGLDQHRQALLNRVPEMGNWAYFPVEHLTMKDLAYLTAKTGHEFAILRGKNEDILFHGNAQKCEFGATLSDMLSNHKLVIIGHSHPGEEHPTPSAEDRQALRQIKQQTSRLISGLSGIEIEFTSDPFEIL